MSTVRQFTFILLALLLVRAGHAQKVYTVESVPNPRMKNYGYVSNPDRLLRDNTVAGINTKLRDLEQKTTVQVAVVMLSSIGTATDFDFAQKLFEKWGIGHKAKDNGLLILFVQDQKMIRLHTGFGLEGTLPDVICKRIQTQFMVPQFKAGRVDEGILAGVEEVIKILSNPAYAEELRDDVVNKQNPFLIDPNKKQEPMGPVTISCIISAVLWLFIGMIAFFIMKTNSRFISAADKFKEPIPSLKLTSSQWLIAFILMPIIVIILLGIFSPGLWVFWGGFYAYLLLNLFVKRYRMTEQKKVWLVKGDYHALYNFYDRVHPYWKAIVVLFPIPFAFMIRSYGKLKKSFRTHPRPCRSCGKQAVRLGEDEEDAYLGKSQVLEEELRSADYDVWKCQTCGATQIYQYKNTQTRYTVCPSCSAIALSTMSTTTVSVPSASSPGVRETRRSCKNCGHVAVTSVVIPVLVAASTSGSYNSTDSSGSSDSSSSSDSGGGFDGGDSGGGGASSSW